MKGKIAVLAMLVAVATLVAVGPGSATSGAAGAAKTTAGVKVPRLVGKRLNVAETIVRANGLRPVHSCAGLLGCLVLGNWVVCTQIPKVGKLVARGSRVKLFADRPGFC